MGEGVFGEQIKYTQNGVAFVGSTLPAAILKKQIESGEVNKIYISHKKFFESYQILIRDGGYEIDIEDLSAGGKINRIINLLRIIYKIKKNKKIIYIYHECCWIWLDICIWIIRPIGIFRPQVNTKFMFQPAKGLRILYKNLPLILATQYNILRFMFKYGYSTNDTNSGIEIAPTVRKYPKSIYIEKNTELFPRDKKRKTSKVNKILILTGSDCASPEEMKCIYMKIASIAISKGYQVEFKDHPNPTSRLNIFQDGVSIINPAVPVEIMKDDYSIVVGTASAAMAIYGERAVSIVYLLDSMSDINKNLRFNYIGSINSDVRKVNKIEEIFET